MQRTRNLPPSLTRLESKLESTYFYGVPLRTKIRRIIFHSNSNVFAVEVEYFEF